MAALTAPPLVRVPEGEFRARRLRDGEKLRAFAREAELWLRLSLHPNVVAAQLIRELDGVPTLLADDVPGWGAPAAVPAGDAAALAGLLDAFAGAAWGLAQIHDRHAWLGGEAGERLVRADDGTLVLWPGGTLADAPADRWADVLSLVRALGVLVDGAGFRDLEAFLGIVEHAAAATAAALSEGLQDVRQDRKTHV